LNIHKCIRSARSHRRLPFHGLWTFLRRVLFTFSCTSYASYINLNFIIKITSARSPCLRPRHCRGLLLRRAGCFCMFSFMYLHAAPSRESFQVVHPLVTAPHSAAIICIRSLLFMVCYVCLHDVRSLDFHSQIILECM